MILPLVDHNDPILRQKAEPVLHLTSPCRAFLEAMKETMTYHNGIGLAAPQVGMSRRLIVYLSASGPKALINPTVLESSEETEDEREGCLSIPGLTGIVTRPKSVVVEALDEKLVRVCVDVEGLWARVLQHEIDHLDGILFIDKADPATFEW